MGATAGTKARFEMGGCAKSAPAALGAQAAQALVPVAAGATVGAEPAPVAVAVGQDGTAGESPALADIRIDVDSFILDFSRTVINVASSRAAASATAGMEGQLKGALDGLHAVAENQKTLDKRLEVLEKDRKKTHSVKISLLLFLCCALDSPPQQIPNHVILHLFLDICVLLLVLGRSALRS